MSESTIAEAMKYVPGTIYHNYAAIRDRHGMVVGFKDFRVAHASPVEKATDEGCKRKTISRKLFPQ